MAVCIYRFVRDLRLDDHAGLAAAAADGEILPVLVIDRALEARLARSSRRAAFFCGAVKTLDGGLRERGSRLIVRRGPPGAMIRGIARATGAIGAVWSASYGGASSAADAHLRSELEEAGLRATVVHDAPAIAPEETSAVHRGEGIAYRAFVPYFDVWRTLRPGSFELPLLVRFAASAVQSEPLPQPDEFGSNDPAADAGSASGRERLRAFLEGAGLRYAIVANVPADDDTSHLSADLSFGTIAARSVVRAAIDRAADPFLLVEERASLRLFLRALAMRDFFLQLAWGYPRTDDAPLQEKMRGFSFDRSSPFLEAWGAGTTGYPLVDAGIRQLHATGWMHPHVRAVAASFLCFDLNVDWRVGRDDWDRYLIEDDPAIATGNWQWIAGVGADMAQYPRIYNPEKQRRRFDPAGAYVQRWVRELEHLPPPALHKTRSTNGQIELPLYSETVYSRPVVDHKREARAFLARYRAFQQTATA